MKIRLLMNIIHIAVVFEMTTEQIDSLDRKIISHLQEDSGDLTLKLPEISAVPAVQYARIKETERPRCS